MQTVDIFRTFQHKDPDKIKVVKIPKGIIVPGQFAQLGQLIEVRGTMDGFEALQQWTISNGALLLASAKKVLYLLDPLRSLFRIDKVRSITYRTDKGRGTFNYRHDFNVFPRLAVLPRSGGMLARLQGGSYQIESEGIVN